MKKFILIILMITLSSSGTVFAKNIKVSAMSDFTTANPPSEWSLKIIDPFVAKNGYEVRSGSILTGRIENVTEPKRLKRNATFRFIPVSLYDTTTDTTYYIDKNLVGKYNPMGDVTAQQVVAKGAIVAGNRFISGAIGPGVALVRGAVKNEQGQRAKSAVVSVYESTPLSYASKGKEMEIKEGQIFTMNFKLQSEEEEEEEEEDKYVLH